MPPLSTLGFTPNPLLEKYQLAFLEKLEHLWKDHIGGDIPSAEFLLFPDHHAVLLASIRPGNSEGSRQKAWLQEAYAQFQSDGFVRDRDSIIPGTDIELTPHFHNPDAEKHNHPDHKKNAVSITFGSVSKSDWLDLFAQSFDIVRRVSPGFMDEISRIIRKVIPFGVSHRVHNSGSYSDVIGHLLMSYPTGMDHPELALLEAILHEYNHNKLNLILQTETLILNDRREIYYSPYRPDARHIHGIYLGLHAITGAYWVIWNAHSERIITLPENWQEKAALYVLKNGLALQVLDRYAMLTPLGKDLLEEMRSVHSECLIYIKKSGISPEIIARAKASLVGHYQEVQKNYLGLRA